MSPTRGRAPSLLAGVVVLVGLLAGRSASVAGQELHAAAIADPDATVTGSVSGPDGQPLAGARVLLVVEGRIHAEALTDASGAFALVAPAPEAMVEIYVWCAGHGSDARLVRRVWEHGRDLAFRLSRGTFVEGIVRDAEGRPVAGAELTLFMGARPWLGSLRSSSSELGPEAVTRSAADGTFRIGPLGRGYHEILIRAPGAGVSHAEGDREPALRDGHQSIARCYLEADGREPPAPLHVVVRPATIRGGLVLEAGTLHPISGARLAMRWTGPTEGGCYGSTDAEGHFGILVPGEGSWKVGVDAPGYEPSRGVLIPANETDTTIYLKPLPRLTGRVVDAGTGEPIPRFRISDSRSSSPWGPVVGTETFADPTGSFSRRVGGPRGSHLVFMGDGYTPRVFDVAELVSSGRLTDLVVTLDHGGACSVRVVDSGGQPVSGARVRLLSLVGGACGMEPPSFSWQAEPRHATRSDAEGIARFENVYPAQYQIAATQDGYAEGRSSRLMVASGEPLDVDEVVVPRAACITGVVCSADGTLDGAASVMISSATPFRPSVAYTDPAGRFSIEGLQPGTYKVIVIQRRGRVDLLKVMGTQNDPAHLHTLAEGEHLELDFREETKQ